jgi:hypothetical protein
MTIDNLQEQEAGARVDSAIVAIHENNKSRDQVTGPRHQQVADSVNVTIGTPKMNWKRTRKGSTELT